MTADNYWGDLDLDNLADVKTPTDILREQGELLTKATNGILEGKVTVETGDDEFTVYFDLTSPFLGNYEFTVIKLDHDIRLYPLEYEDYVLDKIYEIVDEEEFSNYLSNTLSSKQMHGILATLVSQSRAAGGSPHSPKK